MLNWVLSASKEGDPQALWATLITITEKKIFPMEMEFPIF